MHGHSKVYRTKENYIPELTFSLNSDSISFSRHYKVPSTAFSKMLVMLILITLTNKSTA